VAVFHGEGGLLPALHVEPGPKIVDLDILKILYFLAFVLESVDLRKQALDLIVPEFLAHLHFKLDSLLSSHILKSPFLAGSELAAAGQGVQPF
jgi:hypothetical protein